MNDFVPRFPNYNVLDKRDTPSWNQVTRDVVDKRLNEVPGRRFFGPHAYATLEAVCARIIPQPDRIGAPVPIAPFIDRKMDRNRTDGTQYTDMPSMRESWLLGLRGIDEESRRGFDALFADLTAEQQDEVLRRVQRGQVEGGAWKMLPPQKFFSHRLLFDIVSVYYAHPAAWSEIGFGGPASPRGYLRLAANQIDPWEAVEEKEEP
jgi:Gluconate 2-dehydrogenase subunit 3